MKKSILLLSTILLTLIIAPQIQTREINISKKNNGDHLKSGDKLKLSEFTKTNDGIQYKITKHGSGKKPFRGEMLTVHYTGWCFVDGTLGTMFDSSHKRNQPFQFKLGIGQVIKGWDISLADMKPGEIRIVILPSSKAYGSRATSTIPADSTLVFEIEFISAS